MVYNTPMWTCPNCKRCFQKEKQPHSCATVSIESHFRNKKGARELFALLCKKIGKEVGPYTIISLPCCVHVCGAYDFLAVLPKRDGMEIRFALNRALDTPRLKVSVPLSSSTVKNCIDIKNAQELNDELMGWLHESYHLKV